MCFLTFSKQAALLSAQGSLINVAMQIIVKLKVLQFHNFHKPWLLAVGDD